ncbi:MAG: Dps family protein [Shimia sp.]
MADPLHVIPSEDHVKTGIRDTKAIAEGLADVLSDTYRLVFKTHAYHWNIEGPLFYSVHNLTEEQYENMFEAADELAERIRSIGHLAPMRMAEIMDRSKIGDKDGTPSAEEMIEDLAADHERLAHRLHALMQVASETRKDMVTEDLAVERSAFHETAAWQLRALIKT